MYVTVPKKNLACKVQSLPGLKDVLVLLPASPDLPGDSEGQKCPVKALTGERVTLSSITPVLADCFSVTWLWGSSFPAGGRSLGSVFSAVLGNWASDASVPWLLVP